MNELVWVFVSRHAVEDPLPQRAPVRAVYTVSRLDDDWPFPEDGVRLPRLAVEDYDRALAQFAAAQERFIAALTARGADEWGTRQDDGG